MRELVRTYQAFADYSAKHIRDLGLTSSQFDVCSHLGEYEWDEHERFSGKNSGY